MVPGLALCLHYRVASYERGGHRSQRNPRGQGTAPTHRRAESWAAWQVMVEALSDDAR